METGEFDYGENTPAYTTSASTRVAEQQEEDPDSTVYWQTPERLQMAENMAKEAVVLLKNEKPDGSDQKVLPLQIPTTGDYTVAIVGACLSGWTTTSAK